MRSGSDVAERSRPSRRGPPTSLLADALFSDAALAAAFAASVVLIGALRLSRRASAGGGPSWPRELALCLARGLGLAAAFLLCATACWFVGEVASGGRMPEAQLWAGRIVLAEALGLILFLLLRPRTGRVGEVSRRVAVAVVLAGLAVALVLYLALTGPAGLAGYPAAASSPYRLPWPAGVTRLCIQSNRGIVSHRGAEEHAYDFAMPVGSVFCAARGGTVVAVVDLWDGNGLEAPNNTILVRHEDDTVGVYAHLRQGGSLVRPGQRVARGEPLGLSGNVGRSMLPHLHFHVQSGSRTVPISFADVPGDGVPRMFRRYSSGNDREG
jgi:murein DD-endopeptidase MepM/ murein hydrolase activator NlpD